MHITHLAMTGVDQLDSLPCQVNSALFACCLDHSRDAENQHQKTNNSPFI